MELNKNRFRLDQEIKERLIFYQIQVCELLLSPSKCISEFRSLKSLKLLFNYV